ncbi:MAG TPA: hypothetical protein VHN80_17710 [Kineosporiaceae bacterium]|nr:hypothetical protein [Kineosporiaceae bacterium]
MISTGENVIVMQSVETHVDELVVRVDGPLGEPRPDPAADPAVAELDGVGRRCAHQGAGRYWDHRIARWVPDGPAH